MATTEDLMAKKRNPHDIMPYVLALNRGPIPKFGTGLAKRRTSMRWEDHIRNNSKPPVIQHPPGA